MPYRPEPRLSKTPEDPELISEQIEDRRTFVCLPRLSNIVAIYPCSNRYSLIQAIGGFFLTFVLGIHCSYLIGIPLIYDTLVTAATGRVGVNGHKLSPGYHK